MSTNLNHFTTTRPLPVFLMLDVSGSMSEHGKIQALNRAVREMLHTFSQAESTIADIQVMIVTFGGNDEVRYPFGKELRPAGGITWKELSADGRTPMGKALKEVKDYIEDRETFPRNAYRPVVILLSDGMPYEKSGYSYETECSRFISEGRTAKCVRYAMAIGEGAHEDLLRGFASQSRQGGRYFFHSSDAADIVHFLEMVSTVIGQVSNSKDPNKHDDMIRFTASGGSAGGLELDINYQTAPCDDADDDDDIPN